MIAQNYKSAFAHLCFSHISIFQNDVFSQCGRQAAKGRSLYAHSQCRTVPSKVHLVSAIYKIWQISAKSSTGRTASLSCHRIGQHSCPARGRQPYCRSALQYSFWGVARAPPFKTNSLPEFTLKALRLYSSTYGFQNTEGAISPPTPRLSAQYRQSIV